ncbi:MAG TPA: CBS domain-containing protein [Thermodesulfovibrionales bacterium]|nr:CBS domain-containing protein [Thermodesulfovibrionales bacterium]
MEKNSEKTKLPINVEISDDDIYEAMKDIRGYLDITPADVKELYGLAYHHAYERIACSVRAKDVMTARVVSVQKTTPLKDVAYTMAEHGISGLPVVDEGGTVAGMISEKDFFTRMGGTGTKSFMSLLAACMEGKKGCPADPIRAETAADIMSSPPLTVRAQATLRDIATIFSENRINRVPVIDETGRLIGIVSRTDVLRGPLLKGNPCSSR